MVSFIRISLISLFSLLIFAPLAHADWALDKEKSTLAFGSIKKNSIGESNHFEKFQGQITDKGDITLQIDLSSVETWVDIRNDRVKEFLFNVTDFPLATLQGQVDMKAFDSLDIGDQQAIDVTFDLDFHGMQQTISAELVALRIAENTVVVIPDHIIFIDVEKFNLLPGLKKLKEMAKLPSISSAVPIVFHLTFTKVP